MRDETVARTVALLEGYAAGRETQKALERAFRALACERPIPDAAGRPGAGTACYRRNDGVGWCSTCSRRNTLFASYRAQKRENRRHLSRLEAQAVKLLTPEPPPEVERPGPLLGMMEDRDSEETHPSH